MLTLLARLCRWLWSWRPLAPDQVLAQNIAAALGHLLEGQGQVQVQTIVPRCIVCAAAPLRPGAAADCVVCPRGHQFAVWRLHESCLFVPGKVSRN